MAKGDLLIIGGNEDKTDEKVILSKFASLCQNRQGPIGIVTTATAYPEEVGNEYASLFQTLHGTKPLLLHLDSREKADDPELIEQLSSLSGLFMTGGDQLRLTSLLGGTTFYKHCIREWKEGLVIGGTSAGAAVMSRLMIISSKISKKQDVSILEMGSGFGFLEDVIIDQHFSQRDRFSRLMRAIALNPQIIGVGIDENTAIWVNSERNQFEVIGEFNVSIFDGKTSSYIDVAENKENMTISDIRFHTLGEGAIFDLTKRELIIS
ncbi:cyanophycinase [Rossellomorea vietnamensis]|uniref:Cyanophycinase n=1 Tax=Rossellomorea vietnamensis TaxID=218284 RepID=A0A6I6UM83_9BACI|nr:cyanophycinase [Rossellomorea vietnamensis]QHE60749.1 cyanophycinase [Rossellomorea vietnamensis]